MYYTDNPVADFANYEAQKERELAKRQKCSICGEPIADDYCYQMDGEYICECCMTEYFRVDTPVED